MQLVITRDNMVVVLALFSASMHVRVIEYLQISLYGWFNII